MLYLPVACPGSGKSYCGTWMACNDIIPDDAIVSPDRYREILTGNRANQTVNGPVFKIVDEILDQRIQHGLDVYLDATNLNAKLRDKMLERLIKVSADFSLGITILVSDDPVDLLRERNKDRMWPVPDDVFERFYSQAVAFDPEKYIKRYDAKVMTFEDVYKGLF
jgi:predicted kinase